MCHIKPDLEYEPPECVSMLFNQLSSLTPDSKVCDLFIAVNNQLFYYSMDGECLKVSGFSSNIVSMVQDREVLLLALENNSLIAYDWKEGEALTEYSELTDNDTMTSHLRLEERSQQVLVAGEKNGDVQIFRLK